jgi:hypothetical protein
MIGRDGTPCHWCHFRKGRAEFLNPAVRVELAIGSQRMSSLVIQIRAKHCFGPT